MLQAIEFQLNYLKTKNFPSSKAQAQRNIHPDDVKTNKIYINFLKKLN